MKPTKAFKLLSLSILFTSFMLHILPMSVDNSEAPWVSKFTHKRKFDRTPSAHPSVQQGNQCLIAHFLPSLGAQEQTDIAHILQINVPPMLRSADSCENSVSADKYNLIVSRAQVRLNECNICLALQNCEILHSVRDLYDKNSAS